MNKSQLRVSEVFVGIQGEGPSAGKRRLFIRTSGCNLQCDYCDTKYHVEGRELNAEDYELMDKYGEWVLTGGEPTLQAREITKLVERFKPNLIEWETNGAFVPSKADTKMSYGYVKSLAVISPKESRHQPGECNTDPVLIEKTEVATAVKFVYVDEESEKFISRIVSQYDLSPNQVWVMPEGETREKQLANMEKVWDYCLKNNYNFSPRLHILIYGTKRGV